jgi:hypothetical protein
MKANRARALRTWQTRARHLHAQALIACMHFGPEHAGSELEGTEERGRFKVWTGGGWEASAWSDDGLLAMQQLDSACTEDRISPGSIPSHLVELADEIPNDIREAAVGAYWRVDDPDHVIGRGLALASWGGAWARTYRSPGGDEALTLDQEHLVAELTFATSSSEQPLSAEQARRILARPESGPDLPVDPTVLEDAVRRLRQLGLTWPSWRDDLRLHMASRPPRPPYDPAVDLLTSAYRGDLDGARRAVSAGAPIDIENGGRVAGRGDDCASRIAVNGQYGELLAWLLANGADPDHRNRAAETLVHFANWRHKPGMLAILLRNGADPSGTEFPAEMFDLARRSRNLDLTRALLDAGVALEMNPPRAIHPSLRELLVAQARAVGDEELALRIEAHQR